MKIKRKATFKDAEGILYKWFGSFNHMGLRLLRLDTGKIIYRKNANLITLTSNF